MATTHNLQQNVKRDIFLSYRHNDGKEFAKALHEALINCGFKVWFDDILLQTGYELDERIKSAIQSVGLYIPIITPGFCSTKSFAFKEFLVALEVQKNRGLAIANEASTSRPPEFIFPILHSLQSPSSIRSNRELRNYLCSHVFVHSDATMSQLLQGVIGAFNVVEDVTQSIPRVGVEIGRFPVTNLEYRRFINDGGYTNEGLRRWWSDDGVNFWLHYAMRKKHKYFGRRGESATYRTEDATILANLTASNSLFNHFAQPVTGVSFFEAEAYCNWLSERERMQGLVYRLPTESEWLATALQAEDSYPWGEVPPTIQQINLAERADYSQTKLSRDLLDSLDLNQLGKVSAPSKFGAYPSGVSHSGCHDMFGNVWEYLGDWIEEKDAKKITKDRYNVAKIAGHCCFDNPQTVTSRKSPIEYRRPGYRHHVIGFRVALGPRLNSRLA